MKTEIKKIDSTKREISIEVSGDIVKNKFEDVFEQISKEAKIRGFRPGHAPHDILEKKYSSHAHELVMKELIPQLYKQAIEKEGLQVLELPNISDVKLDRMTLSFKAQVEVSPEIPVKNYKGIKVTYKKIEVSPDAIKRNIDSLKEARKIGPVRNTESIGEENKVSNEVDVMDNNFARSLGYPNLAELEKAMERQIYIQEENRQRQKIEKEIVETITNGLDFKLPQSLISRQLQDLVRQAKLDLALKGSTPEKIEEQQNLLTQQLEPEAKAQVKIYLVLAAIAKRENIPIDDHMPHKVMEFLLSQADWTESRE
jgi:FKBP-type peptidyl-prolyl cis-trans isomerase (trigger factor)